MELSGKSPDHGAGISIAKRQLLERWRRGSYVAETIPKRLDVDPTPLSFAQQRLWFLEQIVPGTAVHNIPGAVRVQGRLDVEAVERSIQEILRRHEALRTTFVVIAERPMQVVLPAEPLTLPVIAVTATTDAEREAEISRCLAEEARTPFDLTSAPLFRAKLLRLRCDEHIFILTMHHIATDGWSFGVFLREFTTLYSAFAAGRPSPLAELPIQYGDFSNWQRARLDRGELERQLSYWRKQLGDERVMLDLPTDRPRPASMTLAGARHSVALPISLTNALRAVSQQESATLYMTLLAAFFVLLYRYTRQQDIRIGCPIANRNRAEIEPLIGFFVNTLVIRAEVSGEMSFAALLGRVREAALGAYAHQDMPFEKLVEELRPDRSLSHSPLFQAAFLLQNAPSPPIAIEGLTFLPMAVHGATAIFDLTLSMMETKDGLEGYLEYSTELFDEPTIARMGGHLRVLLDGIAAKPDAKLADLSILPESERHLILSLSRRRRYAPPEIVVHRRFEQQAARSPDATAVVCEGTTITYRELNERANRLAGRLRTQGLRPDVLAGICLDRSPALIVAILGVLKAGGAYLPLDPAYPQQRIRFMIEDAGAPILITTEKHAAMLPEHSARVVLLDGATDDPVGDCPENPDVTVHGGNLAYVIYTSGSTGRPKGVMVTHDNVARLFSAAAESLRYDERDVWTMFHSCAFDFSVWEILGALLYGGRLVIVPYDVSRSAENFYDLVCSERVTVLNQTPSAFAQFSRVDAARGGKTCLRLIIFGGEATDVRMLKSWFDRHGDSRPQLVNMYGITETTVHVTCRSLSIADLDTASRSPIGRPLPDLDLVVLDSRGQPVPLGVFGEAYVGGAGVARGYLGQPGLTSERFVPLPRIEEPGVRYYRTGDLMRRRSNGDLEFLGRIDQQVKIRGFRVELGEIEATLLEHADVHAAVVIDLDHPTKGKCIVAYVNQKAAVFESRADPALRRIGQWQAVFDEIYRKTPPVDDPSFNISGWTSSYTGQPIAAEEMHEWLQQTVRRILALRPRNVLEIGCGTGLLLCRLAPLCERYVGTDISQAALAGIERQISSMVDVTLRHSPADAFHEGDRDAYNLVIINSVAQYFPDIAYLVRVMEHAVDAVHDGGAIFVGDIRSLPLLHAFHASVVTHRAGHPLAPEEVESRVAQAVLDEHELVIDPAFFLELRRHLPRIGGVEVRLKRGRHWNEMTRFRYDVVLHIGAPTVTAGPATSLDWSSSDITMPELRRLLSGDAPDVIVVNGVPDARLRDAFECVGTDAMDPEQFWSLQDEFRCVVDVRWAGPARDGYFDVVVAGNVMSSDDSPRRIQVESAEPETTVPAIDWSVYANRPLGSGFNHQLRAELQRFLKQRLPDYMLPSHIMQLDAFPLTSNGKIDRKALPVPSQSRPDLYDALVAPRTPLERRLGDIWAEVLGVDRVGMNDSFFDLGGHSILATQLIYRLRDVLHVDVPLRTLFERPTVAWMSHVIETKNRTGSIDTMPQADFRAEAVLDSSIRRALYVSSRPSTSPRAILLTGASGFLGAFLLRELLVRTDAKIYCLVRAGDGEQALARLRGNLASLHIAEGQFAARVLALAGDMARPFLGLSGADFEMLTATLDSIYHCGSTVNFIWPYAGLKAANVLGMQELLRVASRGCVKRVHLVSTLHVFSSREAAAGRELREEDLPDDPEGLSLGYTQSKWVAEQLAIEARRRGISVDIFRPGRIWGDSHSGACQRHDFLWLLLKACIETGVAPQFDGPVNVIPVDYASKAIVHLSLGSVSSGQTFHLANGASCRWIEILEVLGSYGYQFQIVPFATWCDAIVRHAEAQSTSAAFWIAPLLGGITAQGAELPVTISCQNTLVGLSGSDISCPSIDRGLLSTYVSHFIDNGFLPRVRSFH
jgi:amino acid adenylation domain-containing protein/thioester reductase-like protein